MSKKQEKKSKESINQANINSDINDPNSYLHQYWFTDNIVDGKVVIHHNTEHHTINIDNLEEVIIDKTNNNTK